MTDKFKDQWKGVTPLPGGGKIAKKTNINSAATQTKYGNAIKKRIGHRL